MILCPFFSNWSSGRRPTATVHWTDANGLFRNYKRLSRIYLIVWSSSVVVQLLLRKHEMHLVVLMDRSRGRSNQMKCRRERERSRESGNRKTIIIRTEIDCVHINLVLASSPISRLGNLGNGKTFSIHVRADQKASREGSWGQCISSFSWLVDRVSLSVCPSINTRQFCIFKLKLCNYLVPSEKFTREDKEVLVKINLACSDNCCPALKNRN